MTRTTWLWIIALLVTVSAAFYQRMTGPSYPVQDQVVVDGTEVAFTLPRTHPGEGEALIQLMVPDTTISGSIEFRRLNSRDVWMRKPLERQGERLIGSIPHQPPGGKVMYRLWIGKDESRLTPLTPEPVVIRFRGDVPSWVLVPHIMLMFAAMLFSTRTGLGVAFNDPGTRMFIPLTFVCLLLGGLILGPVVQKFAFDSFWTGWPLGEDLTDNKTAVAFVLWALVLWRAYRGRDVRWWVVVASVVMLSVFLIPHSLLGSELDYTQFPEAESGSS